jgi:predicted DNA-binding protein (MmcQ/YjbR family)
MLSEKSVVDYLLKLEGVEEKNSETNKNLRIFMHNDKICLVVEKDTQPLRIETRCDLKLSKTLQERYESVMQSRALGRNGIEIICSGQLTDDEVLDLIRHAYEISQ